MLLVLLSSSLSHTLRLAKNLFLVLQRSKGGIKSATGPSNLTSSSSQPCGSSQDRPNQILGRCYQRKTRFRRPIVPTRLRQTDGRLVGIYGSLKCADIREPKLPAISEMCQLTASECAASESPECKLSSLSDGVRLPKFEHTEASLLPLVNQQRKVTIFRMMNYS